MANVRRFAFGDYIELGMGSLTMTGAMSFIALVLAREDASFQSLMTGLNGSTGTFEHGRSQSNGIGFWDGSSPQRKNDSFTWAIAGGWRLVAVDVASGAGQTPRAHINTGAGWSHGNTDGACVAISASDRIRIGYAAASDPLVGDLAFVSIWQSQLSDANYNSITDIASLLALSPAGHWRLGQASTGTNVTDSVGTANQQAISGTSVVTATPWFDPDAAAAPPTPTTWLPINVHANRQVW